MAEALEKVKKTLGPEAVILNTRTLKRGGVLGVGSRSVIEITATRDVRGLPASERRAIIGRETRTPRAGGATFPRGDIGSRRRATYLSEGAVMARRSGMPPHAADQSEMAVFTASLRSEMGELRAMVRELLDRPGGETPAAGRPRLADGLREFYTLLIENEVAEEIARELMAEARDRLRVPSARGEAPGDGEELPAAQFRELLPEVLTDCIESMLPPAEPIGLHEGAGPKFVAFVGPTGVGKTTTLAKLAAHFKLREGRRVGLITTDTYRIAAVEQLRTYADILSIPLQIVMTPAEMAAAVASTVNCDLVLIDTSGRNHRDERRLQELKAFLDAVRQVGTGRRAEPSVDSRSSSSPGAERQRRRGPDGRFLRGPGSADGVDLEVHLVLSCTAHGAQLIEAAERFGALGVDRVVFTKVDEAVGLGVILNVIRRVNLEMSYLTTGQDVPDDIEIGHRRRIAELILGRPSTGACPVGRSAAAPAVDHVA